MHRRPLLQHAALLAVVLVVLAAVAWQARRTGFVSDDAFISFRYARNLAEGNGLVFNPGERVEGYTNLLYVLLVAGFSALGLDAVDAGLGIGAAATTFLIIISVLTVARIGGTGSRPYALAAGVALLLNPYLALWTEGVLETTLFAALLMGLAHVAIRRPPGSSTFSLVSLIGVCLMLTRPEGVAIYALAAAWCLCTWKFPAPEKIRLAAPGILVFLACLALLTAWRLLYYGDWLPNTFYVKSAMSTHHLQRGIAYVGAFARNAYVPAAAALGLLAMGMLRDKRALFLVLLLTAQVIAVGGDGLPAYRFMVPVLAPCSVSQRSALRPSLGFSAGSRLLQSSCPWPVRSAAALSARAARDSQYRLMAEHREEVATWSKAGRWLGANVPADTVVAAAPIGALAYHSRLPVIDMLGLTDRHIARVQVSALGSGWAGHEKRDGAYVLSRKPDLLLLANIVVDRDPVTDLQSMYRIGSPEVHAREYDILSHPTFWKSYRPIAFPLGDGTFLHAFVLAAERG